MNPLDALVRLAVAAGHDVSAERLVSLDAGGAAQAIVFVDAPHIPTEASARDGKSGRDIFLNWPHAASGSIKDGPSSREDETRGDTG